MGMTITALVDRVQTEADAYEYLEEPRWPTGTPKCPHCAHVGAVYFSPREAVDLMGETAATYREVAATQAASRSRIGCDSLWGGTGPR